jgi:hypothetical protein
MGKPVVREGLQLSLLFQPAQAEGDSLRRQLPAFAPSLPGCHRRYRCHVLQAEVRMTSGNKNNLSVNKYNQVQ